MIFRLYKEKPLWGISNIKNKLFDRLRGKYVSIKFRTGKNLYVEGKVRLDCPNITFGENDTIAPNVRIFGKGKVMIGNNVVIGDSTVICCDELVEIGDDTMIAAQCYITDCNHGMHLGKGTMRTQKLSVKKCKIHNDVWIGAGCKILAGSEIKGGGVIGAGTIVYGNIQNNVITHHNRELISKKRM